ncbi:MAG: alpha/beta fold hydrolase [Gammaproteobacteria bacterium]|nr:alpha/beta fold hydrolase [Gammaproteobacteria bacterium]
MNRQFKPSGYNQHFFHPAPPTFADYQQRCHQMIHHVRNLNHYCPQADYIDQVAPYQLGPADSNRAILLIHGLLETPFLLRDIGEHFAAQGYLVRAILLPGHATSPGDLLNIERQAWQQACDYAIRDLCQNVDELYLCGYSTGALLALLAAHQPLYDKIKGLLLFAPAIKIAHYPPHLANLIRLGARLIPRLRWLNCQQENDFARYRSLPINAAQQVYQLSHELATVNRKKKLDLPVFMTATTNDRVVSCRSSINFFQQQPHEKNRLLLYSAKTLNLNNEKIITVDSRHPEQNIVHFSHICLSVAPENRHYGQQGDYTFLLKPQRQPPCYGESHHRQVTHRLSYNPHFHLLMAEIDSFLNSLHQ